MPQYTPFGALDWLVVAVYMLVCLGIGVWAGRGQTSKRDYFLGGREMSWWAVGLSTLATETSALTFIGIPALAMGALALSADGTITLAGGNMFFMMLIVGHLIGRTIVAIWVVPRYYEGEVYTPFQLLNRLFGRPARFVGAVLSFVGMALAAGVRVFVTAIPLMLVINSGLPEPTVTLTHTIILIMVAALVYTAIGGVKAVIWTDLLQYFIYVAGGLFALIYIPSLLHGDMAAPSGAEGWAAIREVTQGTNVLSVWNSGLKPGASLGDNIKNIFAGPENLIMGLIPMTIGMIFAYGFDQLTVQRVLACRSKREGQLSVIGAAVLIGPQFLMFLLIGAALFAYYTINGGQFDIMPWDPATVKDGIGSPNGSYVFPAFIVTQMPPVVKGFLIAAVLAAAMSSVSSALSAMGSLAIIDLWRPLTGQSEADHQDTPEQERRELFFSRVATAGSGVLLIVIAYLCRGNQNVIDLAFTLAGLTFGGILGAFLWGMWRGKGRTGPVVAGLVISVLAMTLRWLLAANKFGDMTEFKQTVLGAAMLNLNWPWHTFVGAVICLLVIVIGEALLGWEKREKAAS